MKDGYLTNNGNSSSMRLMSLICAVCSCVIGMLAVVLNRDLSGAGVLIGAILIPAFGGKWLQSKEEFKENNPCN